MIIKTIFCCFRRIVVNRPVVLLFVAEQWFLVRIGRGGILVEEWEGSLCESSSLVGSSPELKKTGELLSPLLFALPNLTLGHMMIGGNQSVKPRFVNINEKAKIPLQDAFSILFMKNAREVFRNIPTPTGKDLATEKTLLTEHKRLKKKIYQNVVKQLKNGLVIPKRREIYDIMNTMFASPNGYSTKFIAYGLKKVGLRIIGLTTWIRC